MAKNTKIKPRVPGQPEKLTADNMAFSSCNVKAGTCVGLVVATGMRTRVGSIAALLNEKRDDGAEEKGLAASKSFAALDKDGDGALTYDEVTEGLKMRGIKMSDKQIKDMCAELDANGDGKISQEFDTLPCQGAAAAGRRRAASLTPRRARHRSRPTSSPLHQARLHGHRGVPRRVHRRRFHGYQGSRGPDVPSWLFMIMVAVTLTVAAIPRVCPCASPSRSYRLLQHGQGERADAQDRGGRDPRVRLHHLPDKTGTLTGE